MNIALMCHNKKQELMVQFCTAYCGVLAEDSYAKIIRGALELISNNLGVSRGSIMLRSRHQLAAPVQRRTSISKGPTGSPSPS